jgi:hypothetical protein
MISIEISKNSDGTYKKIIIQGHANSAKYGKDIVCAGVSAIVFGSLNAIEQKASSMPEIKISDGDDGLVSIDKIYDIKAQEIIDIMIIQLKTVEESYSKYIKVIYK